MNRNDFSDIDEQIKHTVENAFNYIDYAGMRENINNVTENINNVTESAVNEVKVQMKDAASYFENLFNTSNKRNSGKEITKYINNRPQGKYTGVVLVTLGSLGAVITSLGIVASAFIIAVLKTMINVSFTAIICFLFVILAANIFMIIKGYSIKERIKRFNKYAECVKKNKYCTIKELCDVVFKNEKFVINDLKKMITLDMFREGYFDEDNKYFILSKEVHEEYLNCVNEFKKRKIADEKKKNQNQENNEVESTVIFARKYIEEIKECNIAIKEEEISNKLNRLELIIREIFKYIEKNPQKLHEVKKLTNHYLPITLKLIKSYKELESQSIQGDNIKKAKNEIEKSIDLINTAFEKMLDDLFEDVVLDVSTDISVLETLFKQEGLTKGDFKK